jgi:hypothetical protein
VASSNLAWARDRVRRLWARASNPPVYVARSRLPMSADAATIHAFVRSEILRPRSGAKRLGVWLEWALWHLFAPIRVIAGIYRNGPKIRARTGVGLARQALDQLGMAWFDSIPPKTYYRFRLYEPTQRAQGGDYIHRFETKRSLYPFLSPHSDTRHTLGDKLLFAESCQRHGIRTVPILMEIREGKALPMAADTLPPEDLVIKPRRGRGGRGVVRWSYRGDGQYESSAGGVLDRDALVQFLCKKSWEQPYLVQPRLVNHSALGDLRPGLLKTVRMLTCTNETGDGEVTNASFRLGGTNPIVDNMHRGGIAAAVDLASGKLGPAIGMSPRADWVRRLPENGAPIEGRELPLWAEAIELACLAHRAFAPRVVIGWDMALLPDGPCVLEGNSEPCVNLIQIPLAGPLGSGRFGELVAHRIAALQAERAAAS